MIEFKVGDKVRVRKDLQNGYCGIGLLPEYQKGQVYTIQKINYDSYILEEDERKYNFGFDMLVPVVPLTPKDLQFADVLTIRNGERYAYIDRYMYGESDNYSCDCCKLEENYNNDLTSEDGDEDWDIVKVERKGEVIFERAEETKREMTIEEIEKELGYSIKIVKEVA